MTPPTTEVDELEEFLGSRGEYRNELEDFLESVSLESKSTSEEGGESDETEGDTEEDEEDGSEEDEGLKRQVVILEDDGGEDESSSSSGEGRPAFEYLEDEEPI